MEPQVKLWTPEEYLAHERGSELRHELVDGELLAMTGASRAHNRIVWNLAETLGPHLRERGCEGFANDMRVHVAETGLYAYPDVVVVCGEPEMADDEHQDTLLDALLLIEVLSPSTEDWDRGRKFFHLRHLPSLSLYLLLAQDVPRAELFGREDDGRWVLSEIEGPAATLHLPDLDLDLPLARVYEGVPGIETS